MRNHHGATFVLAILLCAGMLMIGLVPAVQAQDGPIEPIGGDSPAAEVVVEGQRYMRDRDVLVNVNSLQEAADENEDPVYQKPGEGDPLGAVYVLSARTERQATRYLPEMVSNASAVCPAELVPAGSLQGEGATYVSVGPETDMTADELAQIGSTGEGAITYAYDGDGALDEILIAQSQGEGKVPLVRYMKTGDGAVPVRFSEEMTFAGQGFDPAPGAVTSLDGLVKVGCAGLFPAWAAAPDMPFATVVLQVGGEVVAFRSTADDADPSAEKVSTPVATPAEVVEPTSPATEAPTDVPPTATELPPTATATEAPPTEAPPTATATATTVPPMATATIAPSTEVAPTATTVAADDQDQALPTEVPPTPVQGTPAPTLPPARPTPTRAPLQPQAVVPTLPADAPSPPASHATGVQCSGVAGADDANGVPERLPRNLQYAGAGYRYNGTVARADTGELTTVGCAGPFTILTVAADPVTIFLSLDESSNRLFQFEKIESFAVRSQVSGQPRSIQTAATEDQPAIIYRAGDSLVPSVYSSVSLVLYVADPEATAPDRILGYAVGGDVFGVYVPDGSADPAPQDVLDRAESSGVHAQLHLSGQRYVLTSLWTPYGTTSNGWLTLYGAEGDEAPEELAGIDPRQPAIMLFDHRD